MSTSDWLCANQQYLIASLASVRAALQRYADNSAEPVSPPEWDAGLPKPALDALCLSFGLSAFERSVLLLCAGVELDSSIAPLCATAQGEPTRTYPTFGLALAAFVDTAHWSALGPSAPLRRWRLIEVSGGSSLTLAPLRVDERVLHYLVGVTQLDERLLGVVEPLHEHGTLVASHAALAEQIMRAWSRGEHSTMPVVQLCGDDSDSKRAVAAYTSAQMGLNLHQLPALHIPTDAREQEALMRLWEREAALSNSALLLDCDDADASDAARAHAIQRVMEQTLGALIVSTRERRRVQRPTLTLDVRKPDAAEQQQVWQYTL
ncbi:MAG: ATP-binding protein, partial [Chloroflexi bacterium]|nr:ATP-binding protein [Chloroflexota bacterium]